MIKERTKKNLGMIDNKEKQMPYVPLSELPTIAFGKKAIPKQKKPQKGLMTIKA